MCASAPPLSRRSRVVRSIAALCVTLTIVNGAYGQAQATGNLKAKPKTGETFASPLSENVPESISSLPHFGSIEWQTAKLPWVGDGPDEGISGVGMAAAGGKIIVIGGFIPGGDGSDDSASGRTSRWTWSYDPARQSWEQLPDAPVRREYVRAIAANDAIYLVGGACQYKGSKPPYQPHDDCYALDFTSNPPEWRAIPSLDIPRTHMAAGHAGDYLVVAGGNEYDFDEGGYSHNTIRHTVEILSLEHEEDGWKKGAPIPGPGRGWAASLADNEELYIFGGLTWDDSDTAMPTSQTLSYNPRLNTWSQLQPPPISISGWEGALYTDRYAILVGGVLRDDASPPAPVVWSDLAMAYDTEKDQWLRIDGVLPPGAVFNDPGVAIIDDTIYVLGAEGPDGSHYNYFLIGHIRQN